jgi:hypothetical protein
MPEPSHARCVPQEDYAHLMAMMNQLRRANADLAGELQATQRELARAREDGERP